MPAQITPWLRVAKGGLSNVTVVGQTLSAPDGSGLVTLSDNGSGVTCTGRLKTLRPEFQPQTEEISAITSPRDNHMVVSDGFTLDLEILMVDNGVDTDPLETLWNAHDVFKITWREGSVTGGRKTKTAYFTRGPRGADFSGKGQVIARANFLNVDPGATDFYVVATS
jgi:hypothetical protein